MLPLVSRDGRETNGSGTEIRAHDAGAAPKRENVYGKAGGGGLRAGEGGIDPFPYICTSVPSHV